MLHVGYAPGSLQKTQTLVDCLDWTGVLFCWLGYFNVNSPHSGGDTFLLATGVKQWMLVKHFGLGSWWGSLRHQGQAGELERLPSYPSAEVASCLLENYLVLEKWVVCCRWKQQLKCSYLSCKKASVSQEFAAEFLYMYVPMHKYLRACGIYVCMCVHSYVCLQIYLISNMYFLL